MWKKFTRCLKQILPLMKNSLLPAALLYLTFAVYFSAEQLDEHWLSLLHIGFFILSLSGCALLSYFNRNRPLFFIITVGICYCLINYLKFYHGTIYNLSPDYYNLVFFMGILLLFFYFLPDRPFFSIDTVHFLLIIFISLALGEHLSRTNIGIDFSQLICNGCGLQIFGLSLFLSVLIVMLIHSSIKNDILTTSLFFATIEIMLGLYLSDRPTPLALFFFGAMLTVFCGIIHALCYNRFKDGITGLSNGNSFIKDAPSLPAKYGLGIVCIDNYKHLAQVFKQTGINEIVAMVAQRIQDLEPQARVYRCGADEFILLLTGAEKGETFSKIDNLRRNIAASEFYLKGRKKVLKLTVSCSVADKKRSDLDVFAVFIRARKILQKTYKFTQNITSQA